MKINVFQAREYYRADLEDLPGHPPAGIAETPAMAVADLFYKLIHLYRSNEASREDWLRHIKFDKLEVVEDGVSRKLYPPWQYDPEKDR